MSVTHSKLEVGIFGKAGSSKIQLEKDSKDFFWLCILQALKNSLLGYPVCFKFWVFFFAFSYVFLFCLLLKGTCRQTRAPQLRSENGTLQFGVWCNHTTDTLKRSVSTISRGQLQKLPCSKGKKEKKTHKRRHSHAIGILNIQMQDLF